MSLADFLAEEIEAEERYAEQRGQEGGGMSDLQHLVNDVTEWHRSEFGSFLNWKAAAAKLREEANELADIMESWEGVCLEFFQEMADVQLVLCAIAGKTGTDLEEEARKKLEIVRNRDQKARDRQRGIPV